MIDWDAVKALTKPQETKGVYNAFTQKTYGSTAEMMQDLYARKEELAKAAQNRAKVQQGKKQQLFKAMVSKSVIRVLKEIQYVTDDIPDNLSKGDQDLANPNSIKCYFMKATVPAGTQMILEDFDRLANQAIFKNIENHDTYVLYLDEKLDLGDRVIPNVGLQGLLFNTDI